jgi:hypothetical protein
MFLPAYKLKRDYIVSYELDVPEEHILYNQVFSRRVSDCASAYLAFEQVADGVEYRVRDWYIDAVEKTHQDYVNEQVYELVLAELFDGSIGVNVFVDLVEDDFELDAELDGLEKILVEHQAQVKFDRLCKNYVRNSV